MYKLLSVLLIGCSSPSFQSATTSDPLSDDAGDAAASPAAPAAPNDSGEDSHLEASARPPPMIPPPPPPTPQCTSPTSTFIPTQFSNNCEAGDVVCPNGCGGQLFVCKDLTRAPMGATGCFGLGSPSRPQICCPPQCVRFQDGDYECPSGSVEWSCPTGAPLQANCSELRPNYQCCWPK